MAQRGVVLDLKDIRQGFGEAETRIEVLKGANLTINEGEVVGLLGPSGSGKSTLLHIAGLLEAPESGTVIIDGRNCSEAGDGQRTKVRRTKVGFVYQFHHLLPEFTARENVALPQMIGGKSASNAAERANDLLTQMGLGERLTHQPMQMSGGEQQRVAIARALANEPRLLLADEPTGNLDPKTSEGVFDKLLKLVRQDRLGALIATHNMDLAGRMDRVVRLEDGHLTS